MAIGRTFQESLQKALRGLETGLDGLVPQLPMPLSDEDQDRLAHELRAPGANRLLYVADAFRAGWTLARIAELTRIDPWFLAQLEELVREEAKVREDSFRALTAERLRFLKRKGFSDSRLAHILDMPEKAIREKRHELKVLPVYKRVSVLDLRRGVRGESHHASQDHDSRRWSEPHRPGHRVRLLLRARRPAAA
jgi:carbamoyl-phosphate synthase large subunit